MPAAYHAKERWNVYIRGNTATYDSAATSAASPMLGATVSYPLMALLPPVGGVIDVVVGIFSKIGIDEFFFLFDLAKLFLATVEGWHAFLFSII
jgi:hypothetical protein